MCGIPPRQEPKDDFSSFRVECRRQLLISQEESNLFMSSLLSFANWKIFCNYEDLQNIHGFFFYHNEFARSSAKIGLLFCHSSLLVCRQRVFWSTWFPIQPILQRRMFAPRWQFSQTFVGLLLCETEANDQLICSRWNLFCGEICALPIAVSLERFLHH